MTDTPRKKTLSLKRDATAPSIEERLQKVLAQAGLGSRRALEERITRGDIRINGEVAELGRSVKSGDRIDLDGRTFVVTQLVEPASVLLYNKPEGVVTTRDDPEGRPTVFEQLPRLKGARWIAIGRLDINTTGLLLLTTDGELANALMHPSSEVEREYICRIHGEVPDNIVDRLARGVALEDGPAKFDEIERMEHTDSNAWFRVVIKEGRNREVRRLWESQGYQVSRLKRIRYGKVKLPQPLLRGHSQEMPAAEVEALRKQFQLEEQPPVLTLQPVIGQRRAKGTAIEVTRDQRGPSYVNGALDQEERELRRFDRVREERPARGRGKPGGGKPFGKKPFGPKKPFHGPMGADAPVGADGRPARGPKPFGKKPFGKKPFAGEGAQGHRGFGDRPAGAGAGKPFGGKPRGPRPAGGVDAGTGTFRSWYVPEGVDTGSQVAPPRGPRGPKPYGKPAGAPGENRGPRGPKPFGERGPKPFGERSARPQGERGPKPFGERGPKPFAGDRGPRPAGGGGQRKPGRGPRGPRLPEGAPDID